jgi:hypothetical protein
MSKMWQPCDKNQRALVLLVTETEVGEKTDRERGGASATSFPIHRPGSCGIDLGDQ